MSMSHSRNSANAHYLEYIDLSESELLSTLHTRLSGLTSESARQKLSSYGPNAITAHQVSWFSILLRQFKSPFIYMLIAASILSFILGQLIDGLLILLFVVLNALLGFFQEFRSEQALKALKKYTTPHAKVIRHGAEQLIPIEDLVPGDLINLQPGDIIPADLRLLQTSNLVIDESTLTGESEPVSKQYQPLHAHTISIHQATNIAFSSTSVLSGQGLGVVIATGSATYIGSIAKLTVETHRVSSFEKGMGRFSTFVLRLVGITLAIVFFANLLIKGPEANLVDLIIFSIALATAVIPEALPLVITFSLSRGALRLAKHKVVVKRLSAIEDLGGIEVLCTDKTGTITENRLRVAEVFGTDKDSVLEQAAVAIGAADKQKDPFDVALHAANPMHKHTEILSELPFDPDRKRNSVIAKLSSNARPMLIVRGAAEKILPFLQTQPAQSLHTWLKSQGQLGHRVIVVAHKPVTRQTADYPTSLEENKLILTGAISFTDPLKKSARGAIQKAHRLGVAVKVITGDSPDVAGAIGHQVGLALSPSDVITAQEFFEMSAAKQKQTAEKINIFARFSPHQKHQLIDILQQQFEVGFLGEGINDALALKSANVALVVQGASDIAREAADIILLNSSLDVIIDGIEEGREVFANTIKYVKMTLASNFGNFYAVAISSLLIDFLPMLPIQILLVNLLSDFPLTAIATDSVDTDDLTAPESYNLKDFALIATILGTVSTIFDFIFFGLFYKLSPEVLQTNWFIGSVLTELVLLYSLRTKKPFWQAKFPSHTILILTILAAIATLVIPYTPITASIFAFVPPTSKHFFTIISIVVLYFSVTEVTKLLYYTIIGQENSHSKNILKKKLAATS